MAELRLQAPRSLPDPKWAPTGNQCSAARAAGREPRQLVPEVRLPVGWVTVPGSPTDKLSLPYGTHTTTLHFSGLLVEP